MNVYEVTNKYSSWCDDYAMIIVAIDEKHAERKARWSSEGFRTNELKVKKIKLDKEKVLLIANRGG